MYDRHVITRLYGLVNTSCVSFISHRRVNSRWKSLLFCLSPSYVVGGLPLSFPVVGLAAMATRAPGLGGGTGGCGGKAIGCCAGGQANAGLCAARSGMDGYCATGVGSEIGGKDGGSTPNITDPAICN
jgi:hypothetical protein